MSRFRYPRRPGDERIDDPATPLHAIRATLGDQARVNRWLGGWRAVRAHVDPVLAQAPEPSLRVLELGCGGADISRSLVRLARASGRQISVAALDRNPRVLACAREWSREVSEISFTCGDVLAPPFPPAAFDLVLIPSVLHHLAPERAIAALCEAARLRARRLIVTDLRRSALAELSFRAVCPLLRLSPTSRHDGLRSVRRAYTAAELADFAGQAGLANWAVLRHPGFRMALVAGGVL